MREAWVYVVAEVDIPDTQLCFGKFIMKHIENWLCIEIMRRIWYLLEKLRVKGELKVNAHGLYIINRPYFLL